MKKFGLNWFMKKGSIHSRGLYLFLPLLFLFLTTNILSASETAELSAWGQNDYGQCDIPSGLSDVIAISASSYGHTVALKSDGTVVAWGLNSEGQCNIPYDLSGVIAVAAGDSHTVALKSDGTVVTWGHNGWGQCNTPSGLSGAIAVAAGATHTVAIKSDGTVVAWGYNHVGQCNVPSGLSGVTAIAAGYLHTVALKSDGTIVAWGYNEYGQCNVPSGLSGVIAIAGGGYHTVALKSDGTVVTWGWNNYYGDNTIPSGLSDAIAIAAGYCHTVALKSDGTVVTWGWNYYGQCNVPSGLSDVIAVGGGRGHTVVLKRTPILWNKLGSEYEVTHSEIGPNGNIVGTINYLPAHDGNGFKPQEQLNPGNYDIPNHFVDFQNLQLGQRGSIEFWYQADWVQPSDGCRDVLWYGVEGKAYSIGMQYNDWQDVFAINAFNQDQSAGISLRLTPASTPQWTTDRPMHFKVEWDGTLANAADRLKFYIDGVRVGTLGGTFGNYTFDDFAPNSRLRLGSRLMVWDWRHAWIGGGGIFDDIKVYGDSQPHNLPILWNKLGSEYEVTHSEIGPNLDFAGGVSNQIVFEPCQFGNGFRSESRWQGVTIPKEVLNPTKGCYEMWFKSQVTRPVAYQYGRLQWLDQLVNGAGGCLHLVWDDATPYGGLNNQIDVTIGDTEVFAANPPTFTAEIGRLYHIALVWDMNGIDGSSDTARLYIDGNLIAASTVQYNPIAGNGPGYIGRIQNQTPGWSDCYGKLTFDNLKIWGYAKTDFSDRFNEGSQKTLILWNKLGSECEVTNSEIGPNGVLIGAVDYLAAQDGNGFKPQPNPGYYDNPMNYVDFPNLQLSQVGSIEFYYWANWVRPTDGCRNILEYGVEGKSPSMIITYNDWQDLCALAAWNQNQSKATIIRFSPASTPQWTTERPMHFKVVWDGASDGEKMKFYIDGVQVGTYDLGSNYTFDDFAPNSRLRLGSRLQAGQSWWHYWRGDDGIIDDIKVYDDSVAGTPRVENISASLDEDSYDNITLLGSDPDGDELTYSIVDPPAHGEMQLNGDVVTYLPDANYYGSDAFTYRANDGTQDSNVGTVTLQIVSANDAPIMEPIGDQRVDEGQLLEFAVSGFDVDGDALTYSVEGLPAGATFDPSARTFSWIPTYEQAGNYSVNFWVEDANGEVVGQTIQIQVQDVPEPPVARLAVTTVLGHKVWLSAAGSYDPAGGALCYTWNFGDGTGATGTAPQVMHTYRAAGEYTVTLTVTAARGVSSVARMNVLVNNAPMLSTPYVLRIFQSWYLLYASAYDTDGSIAEYAWNSSRDGFLSRSPFLIKRLSKGLTPLR